VFFFLEKRGRRRRKEIERGFLKRRYRERRDQERYITSLRSIFATAA